MRQRTSSRSPTCTTRGEESGQVLQEGRTWTDLEPQVRPLKVGTAEMGGSEDRVPIRWREGVYPKQKGDKESGPRPTPHVGPSRPHRGRPGAQPCRPSKEAAGEDSSPSD